MKIMRQERKILNIDNIGIRNQAEFENLSNQNINQVTNRL